MNFRSAARLLPPEPLARRRAYDRLARALAAAGPGAGALLEWSGADGSVRLDLAPAELLAGSDEPWGSKAPGRPRPPTGVAAPVRALALDPRAGPGGVLADGPLDVLELGAAPGGLCVQTFWRGGRRPSAVWVARQFHNGKGTDGDPAVVETLRREWARRVGRPVLAVRRGARARRRWVDGDPRGLPASSWFELRLDVVGRTAEPVVVDERARGDPGASHRAVFGATGAGKTRWLAALAAASVRAGTPVLLLDLHGDLAPSFVARLGSADRSRVVAVEVGAPGAPGIAAFHGSDDRAAAHFVSAVKRLSPDGQETYWGFRLERLFDAFARLVLEEGGTLLDLYALLIDPARRDGARLSTRRPELAAFLDELGPIVRRNPEFLWPAAARLAKVAHAPALAALLAPEDGGVALEPLFESGRSLVVRLPISRLGPEGAGFAASLLLARAYYGRTTRGLGGPGPGLLAVLDEVQGLSPALVAEMLGEGRKFGVAVALASQFPERLAPELRHAAAASVPDVVVFRVPPASSLSVAAWLGVSPATVDAAVGPLPTGVGVRRHPLSGELVTVRGPPGPDDRGAAWEERVEACRRAEPVAPAAASGTAAPEALAERILLAVLGAEEEGRPLARAELPAAVAGSSGESPDPAAIGQRLLELERRGSLDTTDRVYRLSARGAAEIGLRPETGAARETPEHRTLLLRAFRLFARHGYRLEILRQGRFDTTLPDARLRQIPDGPAGSPAALAARLRRAEVGWAWRFFGGRDVHVEAEVSGALRAERIRHGARKALRRDAFPLFVVGDSGRAARVRRTLRALGLGPDRAQVWTLTERCDRAASDRSAGGETP